MDSTREGFPRDGVAAEIEHILDEAYPPDEPGAAVIVVKDGRVVFRGASGMANLELGVPLQPEHVFRIGSITKQFTAVAILLLVQDGKLALNDELVRFLPDYPVQGQRITVEHLLTHTSGIASYTNLPTFGTLLHQDRSLSEIIDLFQNEPREFAPDERFAYNNSGYVLLGAAIEAVSGQSYEDFLRERIFEPLGMRHTGYDHPERIVPGRAVGYQRAPDGIQNASFVSMTLPYAAGALLSSVDDLARWNNALAANRLVARDLRDRAWTPHRLADGASTGYGYGWNLGSYRGHRVVRHSGGINGFITHALHLPDDHGFVAILTNCVGVQPGPDHLAMRIAAGLIGHPYEEPMPIRLAPTVLDGVVGTYRVGPHDERTILREGDKIFLQGRVGFKQEILPLAEDAFFVKDDSFTRLHFHRDQSGRPASLEISGIGPSWIGARIDGSN